jgi:hypothetical protein
MAHGALLSLILPPSLAEEDAAQAIRRDFPARREEGGAGGMGGSKPYIGLYWTRPAPRVGFTTLPREVEAAAAASRTIRYQRELVRAWVAAARGRLVAERVALDFAPDRDTALIGDDVRAAIALARAEGATLVVVDFAARAGWRPQIHMRAIFDREDVDVEALYPDPIRIDGLTFDPVEHFRRWQAFYADAATGKAEAKAAILARIETAAPEGATWADLAGWLNNEGYRTLTGKAWTAENARKLVKG